MTDLEQTLAIVKSEYEGNPHVNAEAVAAQIARLEAAIAAQKGGA